MNAMDGWMMVPVERRECVWVHAEDGAASGWLHHKCKRCHSLINHDTGHPSAVPLRSTYLPLPDHLLPPYTLAKVTTNCPVLCLRRPYGDRDCLCLRLGDCCRAE